MFFVNPLFKRDAMFHSGGNSGRSSRIMTAREVPERATQRITRIKCFDCNGLAPRCIRRTFLPSPRFKLVRGIFRKSHTFFLTSNASHPFYINYKTMKLSSSSLRRRLRQRVLNRKTGRNFAARIQPFPKIGFSPRYGVIIHEL